MANLVYQNDGTPLVWASSTGDELLTCTSLAASAGRNGALHDFGVAARARRYAWRFWCKFATTPVVGERIDIYIRTSDGSHPDNDDGGDTALSAEDKLKNLTWIGVLIVDEASTTPEFVASGTIDIHAQHAGPTIWNATADALSSTALDHKFQLTPVPMEIQ